MILEFFFWDHFQNVVARMAEGEEGLISFRDAEVQLGDMAHHEQVGQLLLMKSNVRQELVEAVQSHHTVEEGSSELTCLLYLVNNLVKDLGLGYLPEEKGMYSEPLLSGLNISLDDIQQLKEKLTEEVVPQIQHVVELCLSS